MNRRTFLKTSAALTAASTWITREVTAAEAATPAIARAPRSAFSKRLRGVGRILELDGWNVWCCSPIFGPDGKVHVFYARWPGTHDNWLTHSEIAHAVADRPEGPYTDLGTILKGRGGDHWDADTIHNPTIHRIGNRYALFYIGNNLADAKRRGVHHSGSQRIGLALADSIDGPWQRVNGDGLILDTAKDAKAWDSYLTTNPALFVHPNGEFWLYYKAWDRANDNMRKMGVAVSKKIEGPNERSPLNPLVSFAAQKKQVEDAYVWREGGTYYMLMRDMGVIHPHVGLLLTSADGLKWSAPELGYETSDHYFPGEKVQRFERPQILMQDGKARYVFLALMGGRTGTSSVAVLRIDD
jgi:beta-xylosidase